MKKCNLKKTLLKFNAQKYGLGSTWSKQLVGNTPQSVLSVSLEGYEIQSLTGVHYVSLIDKVLSNYYIFLFLLYAVLSFQVHESVNPNFDCAPISRFGTLSHAVGINDSS